jgi:hypothetical protein
MVSRQRVERADTQHLRRMTALRDRWVLVSLPQKLPTRLSQIDVFSRCWRAVVLSYANGLARPNTPVMLTLLIA